MRLQILTLTDRIPLCEGATERRDHNYPYQAEARPIGYLGYGASEIPLLQTRPAFRHLCTSRLRALCFQEFQKSACPV